MRARLALLTLLLTGSAFSTHAASPPAVEPPDAWVQEQTAHRVAVTGTYKNRQYGFSVPLIANIPAFRNASPNPNHGILFFLGGHRTVSVSAEFDAAEYGSTRVQLDHLLEDRGAEDVRREAVVLSGSPAERATFRTQNGQSIIIAQRRAAHGGVLYQLQLSTDAAHLNQDRVVFERIARGVKITP